MCKSTVVRGEDDFPIGVLRVTDCHDTVVYALAPLQYVKIAACSDCQVLPALLRISTSQRIALEPIWCSMRALAYPSAGLQISMHV